MAESKIGNEGAEEQPVPDTEPSKTSKWQSIRSRLTRRRLFKYVVVATLSFTALVSLEALIRARLVSPADRVPTALYTRPANWSDGDQQRPIAIAPLTGAANESRVPVALQEMPDHLIDAVLAVEDRRFYKHHGLDFRRIAGAMAANVKAGGIAQGGSTVTQQLAKNLFLSARRSPIRKFREAAMAIVLEVRYDKEQILESYLNEIYLGQDGRAAIHGVGAASRFYFGKDVRRIGVSEAALLAGMIHAPNRLAPNRHPNDAKARRNVVLTLMTDQERISERKADRARRNSVRKRTNPTGTIDARYFRDVAMDAVSGGLPKRGAAVFTTLDPAIQRAAERAISRGLPRLGRKDAQAALVAIDPRTGEILAMVGGRDYGESQFNRAVDAHRQPGSAFKPIVALAALQPERRQEPRFTLASVIEDEPLAVETPQGTWQPANYDGSFRGPVTFRTAMEESLNVPFARIGLAVGPERIVDAAHQLGIESSLQAVPALALGSGEVTLLELVRAYGVFATGGQLAETQSILGRVETDGELHDAREPRVREVIDPAVAYLVTSTLQGVIERGTGHELRAGRYRGQLAGKSGTTNNWRDAWFIAYSPTMVVGVWVGHDDGHSLRRTGATAALPIVSQFMSELPRRRSESFDVPEGIVEGWSGLAGDGWMQPCGQREVFLAGTEPDGRSCFEFDFSDDDIENGWVEILRDRAMRWLEQEAESE